MRAAVPRRFAGADHGGPHFAHDRAHVREVEIDEPLLDHKVSNAGDARAKHLIRHPESVGEGRPLVGDTEQVLIGDDDQRIDRLAQFGDTGLGDPHAATTLEVERLGDDADRKDAHLASSCGDDGGSACARAAAHAGGEENHVRAGEAVANFLQRLLGRRLADLRPGAGAETFGQLKAHLNNSLCARGAESLRVGIGDDEVDPGQAGGDHIVDRVAPGASHATHHDAGLQFLQLGRPSD